MKTIKKKEKGFALVLSLILLLVMSLMGGGLIVISSGTLCLIGNPSWSVL